MDPPPTLTSETSFSEFLELNGRYEGNEWVEGKWSRYLTYINSELISDELELRKSLFQKIRELDAVSLQKTNYPEFYPVYYDTLQKTAIEYMRDHQFGGFHYYLPLGQDNVVTLAKLNRINEQLSDTFFRVSGVQLNTGYDPISKGIMYTGGASMATALYQEINAENIGFNDKYEELKEEWDRRESEWMAFYLAIFGPPQLTDGMNRDFADSHWEKLFDTIISEFPGIDYQEWLKREIES
jgi:hypothetical protein